MNAMKIEHSALAQKPKVSMLIISFNEKEYLMQAIQSCEKQTYDNIEILIGDDGSTDGSIAMIRDLGDRVHSFVMPRNENAEDIIPSIRVSNVIKHALDEATGQYFAVLSGDDYYTDDHMVEEAIAFLERKPRYCAYVSGLQVTDETGNVKRTTVPKQCPPWMYWSGNYTHISCFVFRKPDSSELLDRMCDDTGLQFVLAGKGRWKFSSKPTMAYRQRERSIQHETDKLERCILEAMILQDILNYKGKALRLPTQSRYAKSCLYIEEHADELGELKYRKYLDNCNAYGNNVLTQIKSGEWTRRIRRMQTIRRCFGALRKVFFKNNRTYFQ